MKSGIKRIIHVAPVLLVTFVGLSASAIEQPPRNRISVEKARKAAQLAYSGTIESEELEHEDDRWVYSFEMKNNGRSKSREIHVDALTGKVGVETSSKEDTEEHEDAEEADTLSP